MLRRQVLRQLATLEGGEAVRIHPECKRVFTPLFQPDEAFVTQVERVIETHDQHRAYAGENMKMAGRRECFEREIAFGSHPGTEDAEYVTYHRTWGDGDEVTGGDLYARNYFSNAPNDDPTEAKIAEIEHLDVLE
jgi:hypothetical protein